MKRIKTDENEEKLFKIKCTTPIDLKHKYQEGTAEGLKVNSTKISCKSLSAIHCTVPL